MKKLLPMLLIASVALLNSCAPPNNAPTSADELKERFETALATGDTNAFLSLYNWDGVPNRMDPSLARIIQGWTEFRLKFPSNELQASVWLWPLREDYETEAIINGIRYRPNVSVIGMIQGSMNVNDNGTNTGWGPMIPYGTKDGRFYFAGTTTEKIYEPKVKETLFEITVTRTNFSTPTAYALSYVYFQNNQEIKKAFTGTNGFRRLVSANDLNSCVLRKLSNDNVLLTLEITEISTNKITKLLDSEISSTNTPLVYEGKQP